MSLAAGSKLGPYEVIGPLGAGGMGEVYRSRDAKLGRDVAIKVLPAAFADDAARMARFEREAQVLAALNHPNIAAIYGIEQGALVMELVEGEDLRGPVPVETALNYARQIAGALEVAHEKGIIHRDLKPANIKVTPEGVVKLLDFGLASVTATTGQDASASMSPTMSLAMTQAGMILGTAAYMSPEQARGKPVDRRADVWAFGVVLFEMLSGRVLFGGGETVSDSLASVMKDEPDWAALPADTPRHVRRLIVRCLRKDPKMRLQAIGEARILLDEPEERAVESPAPPGTKTKGWIAWAAALAVAVAVGSAGWWQATRPAPLRPLMRLNVELTSDAALARSLGGSMLAVSPDGTRLALTLRGPDGKIRLHTRLLHQSQVTAMAGTESADSPFFSPDGQWIGFFSDGKLKKVSVDGGAAVTLADAQTGRGASWGDDSNIIAALGPTGPLSRVPSAGGAATPVTKLDANERSHRWPQVLPGSQAVLFTASPGIGASDDANIDVVSLKTGERKRVQHGFSARYLPSGHLVYMNQNTLFAAPFDIDKLAVTGSPVPMLEDAGSTIGAGADLAFSQTGTAVYLAGRSTLGGWSIFWLDSSGKKQPLHVAPGTYFAPRFSPDGKRLAYSSSTGKGNDLWVKDIERDTSSRLSFFPGNQNSPVWTPDGKHIVFRSQGSPSPGLYVVRSDGSSEPQRLTERQEMPSSFSPDGKRLAFSSPVGGTADIFTAPIEGDPAQPRLGKPEAFLATASAEFHPAFSPDGRWIAYVSNETGVFEVFVRSFPGPGGKWQISTNSGSYPLWSRDGRELMFETQERRLMAVSYSAKGDSFVADKPRAWTETALLNVGNAFNYDLAPDGKRVAAFLETADAPGEKPQTHVIFLLNFFDELRRRTSGGK